MGKSFFFIRTKIDSDVRNEQRGKPRLFDESRMLEQVREDCQKNLEEFNLGEEKVFLVSNHHPAKWDFDRLQKAILDQLPFHQKEALMFCLRSSTNEMLKEKITVLKGTPTHFNETNITRYKVFLNKKYTNLEHTIT